MPIYDYKCSKCEHEIEIIQKINDKPKEVCPKCNKKGLKKQISAPSFRLKGGGWYETDFKTGKKKNIASSDGAKNDKTKETSKTDSMESVLEVSFVLSFFAPSLEAIFFFLPVLKSVSYHPPPLSLKEGAEICFLRPFLLHLGQTSFGLSLIF